MLERIVSGGQTGVDRGALDAALRHEFPCGGWCPPGRLAEDGPIDRRYPLVEMDSGGYPERTRKNIADSDGTLIIHFGRIEGGTKLTLETSRAAAKPFIVIDATENTANRAAGLVLEFLEKHGIRTLNVAGPRGSTAPMARSYAEELVAAVIQRREQGSKEQPKSNGVR
jgi:hypothetical protein